MEITAAMKRIREADDTGTEADDREQQYEMYEKTMRALEDIDAVDDDEGITVVTNWVTDRIAETGRLPSSKAVRNRAKTFCRNNGYEIPNDSWLGR